MTEPGLGPLLRGPVEERHGVAAAEVDADLVGAGAEQLGGEAAVEKVDEQPHPRHPAAEVAGALVHEGEGEEVRGLLERDRGHLLAEVVVGEDDVAVAEELAGGDHRRHQPGQHHPDRRVRPDAHRQTGSGHLRVQLAHLHRSFRPARARRPWR